MHKLMREVITVEFGELLDIDVSDMVVTNLDNREYITVDPFDIRDVITRVGLAKFGARPSVKVDTMVTWDETGYQVHAAWVEWQADDDEKEIENE